MRGLTLILTAALFGCWGCNSNLQVVTSSIPAGTSDPQTDPSGTVDPEGTNGNEKDGSENDPANDPKNNPKEAVEVGDFGVEKQLVQSRSTITILISKTLVDGNEVMELTNQTTQTKLLDASAFANHLASGALKPFNSSAYALDLPADLVASLGMGEQTLRLDILSEDNPRFATAKIIRMDFDIFSMMITHFDTQVQSSDGFQGWVNVLSPATVHNGGSTLSVGFLTIINQ